MNSWKVTRAIWPSDNINCVRFTSARKYWVYYKYVHMCIYCCYSNQNSCIDFFKFLFSLIFATFLLNYTYIVSHNFYSFFLYIFLYSTLW